MIRNIADAVQPTAMNKKLPAGMYIESKILTGCIMFLLWKKKTAAAPLPTNPSYV